MDGFVRFKETLFTAARLALRRADEQDKNGKHSTFGRFLMGQTDELVGAAVEPSDEFVIELSLRFAEILRCTQVLEDVIVYLKRFPPLIPRSRYLTYHVRSYLQEMYILRARLTALVDKYEHWKQPNSDVRTTLAGCREIIAKAFDRIKSTRGADVHERQFSDPELERLEGWEALVETSTDPSHEWMKEAYNRQIKTARENWITQIETNNTTTARCLDVIFDGLFELTFSDDGAVIVPELYRRAGRRA